MRTKNINGFLTGMLATVMVAGTSFSAQAEVIVPANELTTEVKQESPTTATTETTTETTQAAVQTSPAPVTSETQATPTAPTASSTPTPSSGTVTSGTVTSGSTTTSGFSTGTGSPVIGPGMSTSNSVGPGVSGIGGMIPQVTESTNTTDGTSAFAGTVTDPIVKVAEKYTYDQMSQDIQKLSARYGSHMKVNVIGTSLDGRNLYEIVVGNQNAPKHILIHAGIHAREYMTPLLVMKQLEYGLAFYDS